MLKQSLGLVSGAALIFVFAYGCSSSSTDTPAATDAGTAAETSTPTDSGTKKETGSVTPDDGSASTCAPGDVSAFSPTWKPPIGKATGACTTAQVNNVIDCAFDATAAASAACKAFTADMSNDACTQCVISSSSAATTGALIQSTGGTVSLNIAGCLAAAAGDVTATSCGAKYQALSQCQDAACIDNCPVDQNDDGTQLKALNDCETAAQSGVCTTYLNAADCVNTLAGDGGAGEFCFGTSADTFQTLAKTLGVYFCGGAAGDGGADATTD